MTHTIPVISPSQAAAWDTRAAAAGMPLETLMECAGRAAAQVIAARLPQVLRQGVLILAGRGHNGGDGWVIARALHVAGVRVVVTSISGADDAAPLTTRVADRARRDGVREVPHDGPWPSVGLVVDAVLGSGARGVPRAPIPALLARVADLHLPIVAIDGPTGLDLASGVSHEAPMAQLTITCNALRRGHLLARDECGDVVVVDAGLPAQLAGDLPQLVTDAWAAHRLTPFDADAHKGRRGRVLLVGGAPGMSGAVRLAARAAFAAGAGLVWSLSPAESTALLAAAEPDLQTRSTTLTAPLDSETRALVAQADVVVIGPGLGRAAGTAEFVLAVLAVAKAAVIDADALTVLAPHRAQLITAAERMPLLLTPHPGEFRTLCPEHASGCELDPWTAAAAAAADLRCALLLKGVPTVVAHPSLPLRTVAAGNPGLATGGSGDVLAGIAGALLAQGHATDVAGALAAQALGRAADIAARRCSARSLRPMDVVEACRDLWREWAAWRTTPPVPCPPVLFELAAPQRAP